MPLLSLCLFQHHGATLAACQPSTRGGLSGLMMDGARPENRRPPAGSECHVGVTRRAVEFAHAGGVSVKAGPDCRQRTEAFGCAGRTSRMRPTAPGRAADRFRKRAA